MPLIDSFGRKVNYLRLSITDRCNLRCSYCMPSDGVAKLHHQDILSYEELFQIARAAVALGVEKIRVTGGEPLVRKGVVDFLRRLATLPGLRELALTTNGILLEKMASELRQAGVSRLNISLDSLQPETFARITRLGDVQQVVRGIEAAEAASLPIKINMVVMRGVNDAEITDFAALTLQRAHAVRFIEYMPAVPNPQTASLAFPGAEILARIGEHFRFEPIGKDRLAGPAKNYRIAGALGTLGIITPISNHFCGDCNRIRVTSTGRARSCLFSNHELDLRPLLQAGDAAGLRQALRACISSKGDMHSVSWQESGALENFAMVAVGG
ncbi:MAG: GTP 3',8-cyclase MoaA [Desulfuromonadales bacterium]|nr:GTP 3',8-cyclase MoaA [Desulfuromonadales bacterium]